MEKKLYEQKILKIKLENLAKEKERKIKQMD